MAQKEELSSLTSRCCSIRTSIGVVEKIDLYDDEEMKLIEEQEREEAKGFQDEQKKLIM